MLWRMRFAHVFVSLGMLALAGCYAGELELEGKACPCVAGWVCDESHDVCVRADGAASTDGGAARDDGAARDGGGARDASAGDGSTAPIDAGPRDAGPRDGGGAPDAGPDSACAGPLAGALFCDGFEDGPGFAAWPYTEVLDGNLAWIDVGAYRGRGALRARSTAPGGRAYLVGSIAAPDTGDLWLRLYAYFPASADLTHFNFAGLGAEGVGGITLYVFGATLKIWLEEPMSALSTGVDIPIDTWTCIELHTRISDTTGLVELYVDGSLSHSTTAVDTHPTMPYTGVVVGLPFTQDTQPPTTVLIDEVAAGTARLPCD